MNTNQCPHFAKWRAILDRVVSHPLYQYSTPWHLKKPLLQMADFASKEMAHYNNLWWRNHLNSVPAPAPTPEESGADSAAAAVNSGGATFEQVLENGRWKVTIRADRMSGWFERDGEAIGGLIFDKIAPLSDPSKIELTDYDGTFELPKTVALMLRDAGIHVDSTFM